MTAQAMNGITQHHARSAQSLTLLELVRAVGEVSENDAEVVATVIHLLRSGQVRLAGNFRDTPVERILGPENALKA